MATATILHLLTRARRDQTGSGIAVRLVAVPVLLAALLFPFGVGAHTVCADGASIHYGGRWYLSLVFLLPTLYGFRLLYRSAGAEERAAWASSAVIIAVTALVFVAEMALAVAGLFTLCDRNSFTVPAIHLALTGAVVIAGITVGVNRIRAHR